MTRNGHILVGTIAAGAALAVTMSFGIALGLIIGGSAPDSLEMSFYNKKKKRYSRLIPHRTLTHWPVLWAGIIYAVFHYKPEIVELMSIHGWDFLLGYCLSAVLHLMMDVGTPMGLPIFTPFGKRFSLKLYTTGKSEWAPIAMVILTSGSIVYYESYINDWYLNTF